MVGKEFEHTIYSKILKDPNVSLQEKNGAVMKAYKIRKEKGMYMSIEEGKLEDFFKGINKEIIKFERSLVVEKTKVKYRKGDFTTRINDLLYEIKYLKSELEKKEVLCFDLTTRCMDFCKLIMKKSRSERNIGNNYVYYYLKPLL